MLIMKTFKLFAFLLMATSCVFAQKLPVLLLPENATLHFLSPETIQYVDISTKSIVGDLPLKNVLRIKRMADTPLRNVDRVVTAFADAVVTVTGETFIAQYRIVYAAVQPGLEFPTQVEILPQDMRPLELNGLSLSKVQLEKLASSLLFKKNEHRIAHSKAFDIYGNVNHLATFGDYIFLDVSFLNRSNLKYDTDEIRFKIEDDKINKASTVQSIVIKPEFMLFGNPTFRRNYRNVFVFKKFSFPGHKMLKMEMNEKQISGRVIGLKLKYKDVLEADIL